MGRLGQEVDLGICSRLTLRVKPVKAVAAGNFGSCS
jgi:hypothetical protein